VRRDLPCEDGVLLPHPLLDERVPDPIDECDAAGALDRLGHRPARPHVVDDLLARRSREHGLGDERGHEVAGNELTRVVDEEAAVGVPVVCDSEVGALLLHLGHDELPVLGEQRVRLVVREGSVGLEEAPYDVHLGKVLEHRREHRSGHPVSGVGDDPQRSNRGRVDEGEHLRDEARPHVLLPDSSAPADRALLALGPTANLGETGVASDRECAPPDDLHPRVLLGVVRCGDADAAVEGQLGDRVVEHLRADAPDVDDIGSTVGCALDRGRSHRRRGQPHVPTDRQGVGLEVLDVGTADAVRAVLVELRRVEAANVVRLEDRWIEH